MTSTNIKFVSIFLALVLLVLCIISQKTYSCDRVSSYDFCVSLNANCKECCHIKYTDSRGDVCSDKFFSGGNCKVVLVNPSIQSPRIERIELEGFINLSTNYIF